jgi:hypothetical protein
LKKQVDELKKADLSIKDNNNKLISQQKEKTSYEVDSKAAIKTLYEILMMYQH